MQDHMYLNLSDEIDIAISGFIKDAKNTHELNSLCGIEGEAPEPYEVLLRQLEFIQSKLVPDAIEFVEMLKNHKHDWDENEFCTICGADGRS